MLRNPALYGIPVEAREDDPKLEQWRANLIHTAATTLEKSALIKYDRKSGNFQTTELGKLKILFYSEDSSQRGDMVLIWSKWLIQGLIVFSCNSRFRARFSKGLENSLKPLLDLNLEKNNKQKNIWTPMWSIKKRSSQSVQWFTEILTVTKPKL